MQTRTYQLNSDQCTAIAVALNVLSHVMDTVNEVFRAEGVTPPKHTEIAALAAAFTDPPRPVDGVIDISGNGG